MSVPRVTIAVSAPSPGLGLARTLSAARAQDGVAVDLVIAAPPQERDIAAAFLADQARRSGARLVDVAGGATPGAARNAVVAACEGAVLFLDAGDVPERGLAGALLERATDGLAAGPVRVEAAKGASYAPPVEELDDPLAVLVDPSRLPSAWLLDRALWESLGGFDADLSGAADADLWVRALRAGRRPGLLPSPLVRRPLSADGAHALARDAAEPARRALFARHRDLLAADPARALAAQERRMGELALVHDPLHAASRAAKDEIAALDAEILRLEARLVELGEAGIAWGDLRRTSPVSREWGYDRGTPVDRRYIEEFLAAHAGDVRGAVLEVQEDDYTRRFGGARVTRADVLDVDPGNPRATVLADLRQAGTIPDETYDCVILTQTVHVIDDMPAVLREAWRVLRPGGVLLATLPAASRVCLEYGRDGDFWRVTEAGARRLAEGVFPSESVEVRAYGNVMTSVAFLYGAGVHELDPAEFDVTDPYFPLLLGLRAVKPPAAPWRPDTTPPPPRARRSAPPRGEPLVLLYHRIADPPVDVHGLCVTPAAFRAQMEWLRAERDVVPLLEIAEAAQRGVPRPGAVALTFDDGYADALAAASPVLCELELPATFFVTTGLLDGRVFWWDELEEALYGGRPLPPRLDLGGVAGLPALDVGTAAERDAAHEALHKALVSADLATRDALLERLRAAIGPRAAGLPRPLTAPEVRRLTARPGHAVGAHTVHHLALSHQPPEVVRREVAEGRRVLEALLGAPVLAFAYPYGDAPAAAVEAARQAGFRAAVTCAEGPVRPGADPLALPRIEVRPGAHLDGFVALVQAASGR